MKVKFLIFEKNAFWGPLMGSSKNSVYSNVINFIDDNIFEKELINPETKKKEKLYYPLGLRKHIFINKHLMYINDWLVELNKQKEKIFSNNPFQNELTWIFNVDINHFNNVSNIINSNYAVVKIENKNSIEYKFYTLKILGNDGHFIKFEFNLDIFFTYDCFEFRKNTTNFVINSHFDRFEKWGDKITPKKELIIIPENSELKPSIRTSRKVNKTYGNFNYELGSKDEIIIESINFLIAYLPTDENGIKDNISGPTWIPSNKNSGIFPYIIVFIPFITILNWKIISVDNTNREIKVQNFYKNYGMKKATGTVLSMRISEFVPSSFIKFLNIDHNKKIIYIKVNENILQTVYLQNKDILLYNLTRFSNNEQVSWDDTLVWYSKQNVHELLDLPNFNNYKNDLSIIELSKLKDLKKDINLETKLLAPQFLKYELHLWDSDKIEYNIFTLWDNYTNANLGDWKERKLNKICAELDLSPQANIQRFYLNYESENKIINSNKKYLPGVLINRAFLEYYNNKEMPIRTQAYIDFLNKSRTQYNTNLSWDYVNMTIGAMMVGLGGYRMFSKGDKLNMLGSTNAAGGVLGIGGLKTIMTSGRAISLKYSMPKDLQRIPAKINNNSNTTNRYFMNSFLEKGLFFTKVELENKLKKILFEKFYLYGYELQENYNLNNLINSRKIFNYIQADNVFYTLKLKTNLSDRIRLIISDNYANGFTIWHNRNNESFKFVNYSFENWEMNLINNSLSEKNYNFDKIENINYPEIKLTSHQQFYNKRIIENENKIKEKIKFENPTKSTVDEYLNSLIIKRKKELKEILKKDIINELNIFNYSDSDTTTYRIYQIGDNDRDGYLHNYSWVTTLGWVGKEIYLNIQFPKKIYNSYSLPFNKFKESIIYKKLIKYGYSEFQLNDLVKIENIIKSEFKYNFKLNIVNSKFDYFPENEKMNKWIIEKWTMNKDDSEKRMKASASLIIDVVNTLKRKYSFLGLDLSTTERETQLNLTDWDHLYAINYSVKKTKIELKITNNLKWLVSFGGYGYANSFSDKLKFKDRVKVNYTINFIKND